MPLVIPDGFANAVVTIENSAGGASSKSSIALAFSLITGVGQVEADRIANVFRDQLKVLWDNQWDVGPVNFSFGPAPYVVLEGAGVESGTAVAAVYAPPAVAISCTKRTNIAGKRFRGRFYLPGVPETLVEEDGALSVSYLADVQTALDALMVALEADTAIGNLFLLHDSSTPATAPTRIFKLLARTPVATIRKRQRR